MDDTWSRITTWAAVLPPSRPDVLDLNRIRSIASELDRSVPVGVLGSTPEFLDLLHELSFNEIVALERNMSHYSAMETLRIYPRSETVVEGDWRDTLNGVEGRFGLLLSDLTSGNLPYDDRKEFYKTIERALQPNGYFVDKNLTNSAPLLSLGEIKDRYDSVPINLLSANYFSCEAIFCSDLQLESETIDTTHIYGQLRDGLRGERYAKLIDAAHLITPEACVWYYGRPWDVLQADYCADLKLIARHNLAVDQPYFERAFQYVWQRHDS